MNRLNLISGMLVAAVSFGAVCAHAGEEFKEKHPRRAEVNQRVRNERNRINQGVKDGQLNPQQAQQLRKEARAVKQQERADMKANGGKYLTKQQQGQLNQQENQVSKDIYNDRHPAPPTAPAAPGTPAPTN